MGRKVKSKYSAAIVERVGLCGQCQMSALETSILCGVAESDIEDGPLCDEYVKGKLNAELAVRRALLQKAQDGDGNAQKEFLKIAGESRIDVE